MLTILWFDSTFSRIGFDFRILLEAWDDCLNLGIFVLAAAVAEAVIFDTSINGSSFLNKNRTPSVLSIGDLPLLHVKLGMPKEWRIF